MLTKYVRQIMTSPVVTITADRPVSEAAKTMLDKSIGSVVVIDAEGMFIGLLSESKYLPEETVLPYLRQSVLRLLGSELGDPENIEEVIVDIGSVNGEYEPIIVHSKINKSKTEKTSAA